MTRIGDFLRELRGNRSLRDIQKISGVSYTYLRSIEIGVDPRSGNEIVPTPQTLEKLAAAYNRSYAELMVLAGYWPEDELLEPISPPNNKDDSDNDELLKILNKPQLKYKGNILTDQDRKLTKSYLDALFIERLKED
jgi:transcriptional regulator with XRE-family HTH domain